MEAWWHGAVQTMVVTAPESNISLTTFRRIWWGKGVWPLDLQQLAHATPKVSHLTIRTFPSRSVDPNRGLAGVYNIYIERIIWYHLE
jgi:hypothetical protein